MDAVVDGQPVTPRYGRAVEVNALWHAALKAAARLERLAEEGGRARELEG
jgi:glycogen debranching enzyme